MKGGYNFLLHSAEKKSKRIRSRKRGGKKNKTRKGGNLGIRHYYKYNSNVGCRVGGKRRKIKGGGLIGNITGSFDTDMVGGSGSLNNFGAIRQIGNFNNSLYPV